MWSLGSLINVEKPRTFPPASPQTTTVGARALGVLCPGRTEGPWLSTSSLSQLLLGMGAWPAPSCLLGWGALPAPPGQSPLSRAGWINCLFCSQVSVPDPSPSPGAAMKTEPGLGEPNISGLFGEGLPRDQEHSP